MNFTFSHLVTRFFISYLANERGLSENTVAAYSDCMRLLINYACERFAVDPDKLNTGMFTQELILEFLDHLERDRKNCEASRNQRLAAIKTFFQFLARTVPELMHLNERIQAIRPKRTDHLPPPSLTVAEVDAIIASPDPVRLLGARDKALLQTFYNTGARVQELVDLTIPDLRFDTPAAVTLTGKGRKRRTIPLWPETVRIIRHYLQARQQHGIHSEHLFLNVVGQPMTRFGIGRRVQHHAAAAAVRCSSLRDRRISPHVFRHTTALHLIEAGNDITVVKDWLGHADLKTTSQYVEVSIERKREALEKAPAPRSSKEPEAPSWREPPLMAFLVRLSRKACYVAEKPQNTKALPTRGPCCAT
jgi:site-specific recombinase XerD